MMTKVYGFIGGSNAVCIDGIIMNKDVNMLIWVTPNGRVIYDYWVIVYIQKHIRHAIE